MLVEKLFLPIVIFFAIIGITGIYYGQNIAFKIPVLFAFSSLVIFLYLTIELVPLGITWIRIGLMFSSIFWIICYIMHDSFTFGIDRYNPDVVNELIKSSKELSYLLGFGSFFISLVIFFIYEQTIRKFNEAYTIIKKMPEERRTEIFGF